MKLVISLFIIFRNQQSRPKLKKVCVKRHHEKKKKRSISYLKQIIKKILLKAKRAKKKDVYKAP